jgi:hypothetical protein
MSSSKKPEPAGEKEDKKPQLKDGKGTEHDVSHMKIHEVVQKFGPAHEMHSEHDHEAGTHSVHTVHGEKHHKSQHDTAGDALHHMHTAVGAEQESADEKPEPAETPDEPVAMNSPQPVVPGM